MKKLICFVLSIFSGLFALPSNSVELPETTSFIDEMVDKHHFERAELTKLFEQAEFRPEIIEAISRPPKATPWVKYRASFVNKKRIRQGEAFWRQNRMALIRAEKTYGVPPEIIVALIGVETVYGRNTGKFRILDALTTLAFDYPRRAEFFRDELENYLLLARDQQFDLLQIRGSYAGAIGIPQFMPSSYRHYAVDFNGNGDIDLRNEAGDAIGSVANYLKGYGWIAHGKIGRQVTVAQPEILAEPDQPRSLAAWAEVGVVPVKKIKGEESARLIDFTVDEGKEYWLAFNNFDVITRYNNSDYYAMSVFQLAEALRQGRNKRPARN
ncbi:MAG: lytic murein transglycosylase B [Gallionella sp.]|nr:lytic murein transglycosylase B [Gallionella sp.]MDD4946003.1 lytic murein transglycosylase B [Gallionella sp.]MDD5613359.1 lytic murein transglycosylase B [Gallionella sp.]